MDQSGSEGGGIVRDEEHTDGARITIEEGIDIAPYSITCGVYGLMCHTRFFGSRDEADSEFEKMKIGLAAILEHIGCDDRLPVNELMRHQADEVSAFVEQFP